MGTGVTFFWQNPALQPNRIQVPKWTSPDYFCRFLCGVLTPDSLERTFWDSVLKRKVKASTFAQRVAPGGLWCARGMHDIEKPIRQREDVQEVLARTMARRADYASYSLNVAAATVFFAIGYYLEADLRGTFRLISGTRRGRSDGLLIVSKVAPQDLVSWGTDSESGLFYEAEVHVGPCEPRCVQSVFLCSKTSGLPFKRATKAERVSYALDDHIEIRWRALADVHWTDPLYENGLAILTPSCTACAGPTVTSIKKVRHTPKGYDWYRVL